MTRRRYRALNVVPANEHGLRRALSAAVARGDTAAVKRLTKRAVDLQAQLFGPAGEPNDFGRPFDDSLDDLPF